MACRDREMATKRPIKRLTETGPAKAKVLTPRELKKLLFIASLTRNPERNTLIIWLLFGAGFRITEVACIAVQDVLLKSGKLKTDVVIPAKFTKNGEAGHEFLHNRKLQDTLNAYVDVRLSKRQRVGSDPGVYRGLQPHSPLILSENGAGYSLKKKRRTNAEGEVIEYWAADTLQELVSRWGKEAGIKNFKTHSGRRTLATRLSKTPGLDEQRICALLRHKSDDMPYEYIDLDEKYVSDTLERMYANL